MAFIPPETLDQIIAANDIVDVIGGYFPLRRAGGMFKALCPFHQERTPSFSVNPRLQIFKCFGCGAGGNVISFVRDYENLDFLAAAKKLADRAGIRLEQGELSAEDAARHSMRRRLLSLHAEAADFFHHQLVKKASAQVAREYLKGRGIGIDIARSWKIGYAPDGWDSMREFAQTSGYSTEELIASGLVKAREEEDALPKRPGSEQRSTGHSQFYDRFRGRVMFPICNDMEQVIAFSGRILEADAKAAKYVNSPETILFTKGAVLFGLHKSKRAIIEKSSAIVCEGQIDLITIFEAGVPNVIAPQGTAFTDKQARILKRFVQDGEVVLCFDADAAGQKAAERSTAVLLTENLAVRIVEMPAGEDPDSLIRSQGAAAFLERVAAARSFFDFQLDRLASRPEFATPGGQKQAARKMAETISLISDEVLREAEMNNVTRRLGISTNEFVRLLKAPSIRQATADPLAPAEAPRPRSTRRFASSRTSPFTMPAPANGCWRSRGSGCSRTTRKPPFFTRSSRRIFTQTIKLPSMRSSPFSAPGRRLSFPGCWPKSRFRIPCTNASDCWRDLERRRIQRRMEAILTMLKNPDLDPEEQLSLHQERMKLRDRLYGSSLELGHKE